MLSDVMEDYLKAIYTLQREHGPPVTTSAIAEYLDVTAPTVTSMVEKLETRGFVDREKYRGVELTDDGETVALEVLRHHRLIEVYLTEHLDYDWSDVHDEADVLEHHISEEFERRVAEALGNPTVDPHGDPIPSPDLRPLDEDTTGRLVDHEAGDTVTVVRVNDRNDADLEYLDDAAIRPGVDLDVVEVAPFGMITVETPTGRQSLPAEIAAAIRVESGKASPKPQG